MIKLRDNYLYVVFLLTIAGFILRIYKLGSQSLWIDEAFSINAALATLKHGYPLLDSGFSYIGSLLHTYLISLSFIIFGEQVYSARLISVIFGVLCIPLIYILAKEIFNKKVALISAFFLTFYSLEIAWSRQARMYAQLQFFFLLSLLFFYKLNQKYKLSYLVLTLLFTLLTILSHSFGFILIPIYLIYLIIKIGKARNLLRKITSNKERAYLLGLFCVLILAVFVIQMLNYIFLDKIYLSRYLNYLRTDNLPFFYLGILGGVFCFNKKNSILHIAFVLPLLVVSFLVYLLHYRYVFFILPILFIFSAYLILYVSRWTKKFYIFVTLLLMALISFNGFTFVPQEKYKLEKLTPQPEFEAAYKYIKENAKQGDVIIDAYPALGNLYLGKVNYGLNFSLTGRSVDIVNPSYDVYTNVPFVDLETLKNLTSCWVIADDLGLSRIDKKISEYIKENIIRDLYNNSITIYKCENNKNEEK